MIPQFRFTFYRRIQISFLLLILLPTVLVSFFNYSTTNRHVKEKITLSNEAVLAIMGKDLSKMIDDLTFASNFFVQDPNVRKQLRSFADVEAIDSSAKLNSYQQIKDFFSMITAKTMNREIIMFLANRSGFIVQSADSYEPDDIIHDWNAVRTRVDADKPLFIQWLGLVEGGGKQGHIYYMSRVLRDPSDNALLATLLIGVPDAYFRKFFQQTPSEALSLFDASGERIAGSANIPYERQSKDHRNIRSELVIDNAGWKLVYETPSSQVTGQISRTFYLSLLIVLPFFILFWLISFLIAKRLYRPVRLLQRGVRQFGEGNRAIRFQAEGKDEIAELGQTLNEMLEQINTLISDIEQEQEQKRVMELQALFAQIRPHFLLNTLNSIKCNLRLVDDTVHSGQIDSLMSMLRAYMRINEPSTLESECKLLVHYVDIMKMRSDLEVSLDITLADAVADKEIPKLLLQPIVENAMVHGFAETRQAQSRIEVEAIVMEGMLEIRVSDNGIGLVASKQTELNEMLEQGEGAIQASYKRIGLFNVRQRLRLTYGSTAIMRLETNQGGGTTVLLRVPL
ncbi:HAMP domain-containing protein [Paenibacillus sp. SYP-B3998]|uniref:HAMP domain-containing protein n=1 Tax=Paenibacillus sp. SYP-B3998 TaxID=2678564 RepID=A0A6G3ZQU4_9BACL|nr:histidine kinase [Paenibacillus sp. SYP-B3998]NEW04576.1 HAMP domain-containing protein [Paenibacillus sp. SYP-B3998]